MIRNVILLIIIFITAVTNVFADTIPTSSTSIKNYGIGVYKIEQDFSLFSQPDEKSKIIRHIDIPSDKNQPQSAIIRSSSGVPSPFIISIPSMQEYFMTVYEYPENDWIEVYYNQKNSQRGFLKFLQKENFMTWKEFFLKYGKKNGLIVMKDLPEAKYKLYSQDSEKSQVVDTFTYPQYIAMRIIRGNWMLVTVVDSGTIYKTGWIKWRGEDGTLYLFPKFKI